MERSYALSFIEAEAGRIVQVATDPNVIRAAMVPTCPRWTLDDLLNHLGRVYAMVATVIADRAGDPPDRELIPTRREGQDPVDWVRERLDLMLAALSEISEDAARWNFVSGPRSPVAFWWRRQVHETLVHRVDAELAAGTQVGEVTGGVAADGIEECLLVNGFREVPTQGLQFGNSLSLRLHAMGTPEIEWTIDTASDTYTRTHTEADVALQGPVWSLNRWMWRRGSLAPDLDLADELVLSELSAIGDIRAAEDWRPTF